MSRRVACVASAFVLLLAPLGSIRAQGIIGGRVLDEASTKPLSCIEVGLVDARDRVVSVTRVRRDGSFEFPAPERGVYRLAFLMSRHTPLLTPPDSLSPTTDREQEYRVGLVLDTTASAYYDSVAAGLWFKEPGQKPGPSPRDFGVRTLDGSAIARYAIDVDGTVIPESVKALRSSAPAYARAFTESVVAARFITSRFPAREPVCVMKVEENR